MTQGQDKKYPSQTAADFLETRAGTAKDGDLTRLLDQAPDIPPSSWDSFFLEEPAVSDDFMTERADQDQGNRESL